MNTIDVGVAFSRFPAGRFRSDGPHSGERFRDELLVAALRAGAVTVLLDGAIGYGSSFLEEAFGGLVRCAGLSLASLEKNLKLVSSDRSLVTEIWGYIRQAGVERGRRG